MEPLHVPAWLTGFLDDASPFPPTSAPLPQAVAGHRAHRGSEYAALVGHLVVPDVKLPDLIDALDEQEHEDSALPISLLVTGGAGALAPAVRWATRAPTLGLRSIEFGLRDEDDLARNAQRWVTALDSVDEDLSEVPVYVELPPWTGSPSRGWLAALDEIAAADLRAKLRVSDAVAGEDLVTSIDAALDRELPFKVAGLTRAVSAGHGQIGFLNLLAATRACLDGSDLVAVLSSTDPTSAYEDDALDRTRRWLVTVGCHDILEAHDSLVDLGLVTPE